MYYLAREYRMHVVESTIALVQTTHPKLQVKSPASTPEEVTPNPSKKPRLDQLVDLTVDTDDCIQHSEEPHMDSLPSSPDTSSVTTE